MRRGSDAAWHLVCLLAVTVVSVYLYRDLIDSHAFLSHEQFYTYLRADQVAKEFVSGHFPQAFRDAIWGAGFAFPRFYPPLSLWLSATLALLCGDTCLGVNLAFLLSVVASAVTMYISCAALVRDRLLAFAATVLYVSMPYRFVDVFARGALAEAWTFAWYPVVTLGLWRAVTRRTLPWYLPVGVGALLLTHNITALYFLLFCAAVWCFALVRRDIRGAAMGALGLVLGFGLAIWFLLPQQIYMRDVRVSDSAFMWADDLHVHEHRVMPWQFFYSLPHLWFGESHDPSYVDGMSFELGLGQLLLVPIWLTFWWAVRAKPRVGQRAIAILGRGAVGAWGLSVMFMLWPVLFLTVLPKQFAYVQFPWRLLALSAFFSALAICLLARASRLPEWGRWGLVTLSLAIAVFVPSFERTKWTEPDWTDATILTAERIAEEGGNGYTVLAEYLPKDYDDDAYGDRSGPAPAFEEPRLEHGEGASIVSWTRDGLDMRVRVDAPAGATLVLPLVYYNFYRATADGTNLPISSDRGFLSVHVPAGAASVEITRGLTPLSKLSIGVSLGVLLITVGCALAFRRPRPRRRLGALQQAPAT